MLIDPAGGNDAAAGLQIAQYLMNNVIAPAAVAAGSDLP
jgi:hypothetical protein